MIVLTDKLNSTDALKDFQSINENINIEDINKIFPNKTIEIQKNSTNKYNSLLLLFNVLLGNIKIVFNGDTEVGTTDMLSQIPKENMNEIETDEIETDEIETDEIETDEIETDEIETDGILNFFKDYFDSDGSLVLEKHYTSNSKFYDSLLNEILHFYYYHNKKSDFSAYIHLYRAYEYVSYTFPLIFVSNSINYENSYKELQKFFSGKGEELAFFRVFLEKKFLVSEYIFEELYDVSYVIKLNDTEYNLFKNELGPFLKKFNSQRRKKNKSFYKSIDREKECTENEMTTYLVEEEKKLVISILDINDLLIELRNKSCHFKINHSDSISFQNYFFDDLFRVLNPVFLNWFANILKFVVYSSTHS